MRKIPALLLILLLPGLLSAQTMTTAPSRPLVLTHLTVIDVTRGQAKSDMTVMIEGEHIVIVRKSKLLVLKPLEFPEPVPMRPPGYFNDCYDREAIKESNRLASHSVRKVVK